ncbi:DNA methyltransferase [Empedobacter sp.]|uniref:DNA methyltransferase n=1 Tax=Empedobacter sp. TaxID=1927715 RepID=UPI0028AA6F1F|nr:DNA methyltransferase [Empedobacter sp.]
MALSIAEIEQNIQQIFTELDQETFIYDFILSYGVPKATIASLKAGRTNLSKVEGEVLWKKKMFFKIELNADLHQVISELKVTYSNSKASPRFVIVTNFKHWLAIDMETGDTLDCSFEDLKKHFDFFLPFAGIEKAQYLAENPADVKAAEKMAKLYDQINTDNEFESEEEIHQLNVFLSRLLFCFFAEDTGIFDDKIFTNAIISNTKTDGTDLVEFVRDLFQILNLPDEVRPSDRVYLHKFPYVNGGLFREQYPIPHLSFKARNLIIECGNLDWSEINPDIFGSMIQAVVTTDKRGGLGMHYTSVPNIMKVINPLFLDDLREELINASGNEKQLRQLLDRLSKLKIFDPACGSGNFLIISYKELRLLENEILNQISELKGSKGSGTLDLGNEFSSIISLNQFYGIEIDDFAHEIARLSLWLAEHQMNQLFHKEFGYVKPALPLKDSGNIVRGNACRLDWEAVCPKQTKDEIYILGNPPYLGAKNLDENQKDDIKLCFGLMIGTIDYISCWFKKGSDYIIGINSKLAFVSTNSICQGEQVSVLWPRINENIEIDFAYSSFKWENNAKNKAGVTVIILALRNKSDDPKYLFKDQMVIKTNEINFYLVPSRNVFVNSRTKPLSFKDEMKGGNVAYDYGIFFFEESEYREILVKYPDYDKYFKKILGGQELLNGGIRYCLWLKDEELDELLELEWLKEVISEVKKLRLAAKDKGTHRLAERPHQFRDLINPEHYLAIPKTSSENREYIPMGYFDDTIIPADSLRIIDSSSISLFSILSSNIHNCWVKLISGKLETRVRYSKELSYNTFPFPKITKAKEQELEECAYHILEVRERYPEKTLAQLYDPDKMPEDLKEAHRLNDLAVESCYREKPFTSDEERLEYLFKLYEKMTKTDK